MAQNYEINLSKNIIYTHTTVCVCVNRYEHAKLKWENKKLELKKIGKILSTLKNIYIKTS